jgi:type II secretory pathway pseudopilin PulG
MTVRTDSTHAAPVAAQRSGRAVVRRPGFTLLEAALVTVIVGVATVAMIELLAAGTVTNAAGTEMATAVNLASNIREISLGLAFKDPDLPTAWSTKEANVKVYDDVKDLDGCTFSPPIDARGEPIAGYGKWAQVVTVDTVAPDQVTSVRPKDPDEMSVRVTVRITHSGKTVHTARWLAFGKKPAAK